MAESPHIFNSSPGVWPENSDLSQMRSGLVHLALGAVLEGNDSLHLETSLVQSGEGEEHQQAGDAGPMDADTVPQAFALSPSGSQSSGEPSQQAFGSYQQGQGSVPQSNSLIQQAFDAIHPDMDYVSVQPATTSSLPQTYCGTISLANSSVQPAFESMHQDGASVHGSGPVQQNLSPNIQRGSNTDRQTLTSSGPQGFDSIQAANGSARQIYDSIQLENGSGPASAQQGFGAMQPADSLVQPGYGSIQKANVSVQLSYSTVQPAGTVVQPGFCPVQQGGSSVQLSYRAVKPAGQPTASTVQQGYSVVQPSHGSVQHSYSMVQPSAGCIQPGYGLIQPSSASVHQGYSSIKLGNNAVQQGYGLVQSTNGSVHPGYGSFQLGASSVQQGYGLVQSANGSVPQGYGVLQSGPVKQGYGQLPPASGLVQPEFGSLHPANGSIQSNYGTLRPNSSSVQQGYDLVQNDNGSLQLRYDTLLSYNSPQPSFPNHPASSMYYTLPLGHQNTVGRQVINGSVVPMQELNNNAVMISSDGLVHGPEEVQQMMYGVLKYSTDSPAPPSKTSRPRKCPAVERPYIKKPQNAFMLFMKEQRPLVMEEHKIRNSANVNAILGQKWKSLSKQEQAQYFEQANSVRRHHEQEHPEWSYRDNYGQKRKRDRRKKIDLDNNSAAPAPKPKEDQTVKENTNAPVHSIRTDILAEQYQKYSASVKQEPATPTVAEVHYLSLSEEKMLLDMLENFESNTDKSVADSSDPAACALATITKVEEDPVKRQCSTESEADDPIKFSEDELLLQMLEDPYWAYKKSSSSTQQPNEDTSHKDEAEKEPSASAGEVESSSASVGGAEGESAHNIETKS
ncbi:uncharacterized protein LOC128765200 [Synchiropus splendidus]|uniref:uncharacterized protein LOC128765200 n=1 Tax=Synchiropus splendidus TaxID=270530 RepID=UPI00237E9DFE|nr:uncharacterized protein LOC128765200 [Synchiropus splendidus]